MGSTETLRSRFHSMSPHCPFRRGVHKEVDEVFAREPATFLRLTHLCHGTTPEKRQHPSCRSPNLEHQFITDLLTHGVTRRIVASVTSLLVGAFLVALVAPVALVAFVVAKDLMRSESK